MLRLFLVLPVLTATAIATPSMADVTHSIETRFGVAYVSDGAQSRTRGVYSGRYTSTFSHEADNGYTFRFEIELEVGNFSPNRRGEYYLRTSRQHFGAD